MDRVKAIKDRYELIQKNTGLWKNHYSGKTLVAHPERKPGFDEFGSILRQIGDS